MAARINRLVNKTSKYNIDSRLAEEAELTHKRAVEIMDIFFEILREECSLMENGEKLNYKWLKFECKKTPGRTIHPNMIGNKTGEPYAVEGKLKLYTKVLDSFYNDPKKGIESNWGA